MNIFNENSDKHVNSLTSIEIDKDTKEMIFSEEPLNMIIIYLKIYIFI